MPSVDNAFHGTDLHNPISVQQTTEVILALMSISATNNSKFMYSIFLLIFVLRAVTNIH